MKKTYDKCTLCGTLWGYDHNGEEHIRLLNNKFRREAREYKARYTKYVIYRFPNTPEGLQRLKDAKLALKDTYYNGKKTNFRVYGRCKNVRKVFERTGRKFRTNTPISNDITLKTPESKYCYEWVLYVKPVVKKRA